MTKKKATQEMPTTSDAEYWPTPDTFTYKGQTYKVTRGGKVERLNGHDSQANKT